MRKWARVTARTSATPFEAARKAEGWANTTGHARAQILYYIAENLAAREDEFAARIVAQTGGNAADAATEVATAISRLFSYAAWADKFDGQVHHTPLRSVTVAMPEAVGVIGIACPTEYPLLGLVSLVAPAIAMGNTVVAIPSEVHPLSATDLYQGVRHLRPAGRRGQPRHRRTRHAGPRAGRPR